MALTIDELRIEVDANAKKANTNIDNLAKSLNGLKSAVGDISGLGSGLQGIANGLRAIATLPKQTTSLTTYANGIKNLETAIKSLDSNRLTTFSNQMRDIADGLSQLSGVGNGKFVSLVNSLKKIPEITQSLDPTTITNFASSIERLTAIMTPLAIQMEKIANGFNAMPSFIKRAVKSFDNAADSNRRLKVSFGGTTKELAHTIRNFRTLAYSAQRVAGMLRGWFDESNEYIEALNLFRVSMGDASEAALDYADTVSKAMGIDPAEWITNQGAFMRMSTGFGISAEQAEIMSKNLTQLAYDMSSFFNVDVQTAMDKLQSGMSGQIKGLKEYGYNLSVAALQETALSLGIEQSVRSMTEAQKAQLRYITLIQKSQGVMGDMAKTINTPANALRILEAQMEQFRRQLGNLVSVLVTKFIPWLQAGLELLTEFTTELVKAWGFEIPELPENNLEMGADVIEGIGDEANDAEEDVESLKKQLMGFDEINILSSGKDDASTDEALYDLGFKMPDYDFLSGLDKIDLEPYKKTLKDILKLVKNIGTAFALWKIGSSVNNFVKMFNGSNTSSFIGKFLSAVGNGFKYAYSQGKGFFTSLGTGLKNAYDSIPQFTKVLLGAGGLIAGIMLTKSAGEDLAEALANDNDGLGGALLGLVGGVGLGAVGGAMIGGPIGAVVGGLAALASGLLSCARKQDELAVAMMTTEYLDRQGQSIDDVRKSLENYFGAMNFDKQLEWIATIEDAQKSYENALTAYDEMWKTISTKDELDTTDIDNLSIAINNLAESAIALNKANLGGLMSSIANAIETNITGALADRLGDLNVQIQLAEEILGKNISGAQAEANDILEDIKVQVEQGKGPTQEQLDRLGALSEQIKEFTITGLSDYEAKAQLYGSGEYNLGSTNEEVLGNVQSLAEDKDKLLENAGIRYQQDLNTLQQLIAKNEEYGWGLNIGEESLSDLKAAYEAQVHDINLLYDSTIDKIAFSYAEAFNEAMDGKNYFEPGNKFQNWATNSFFGDIADMFVSGNATANTDFAKQQSKFIQNIFKARGMTDEEIKEMFKMLDIPYYASGGFPSMGEMFIARESGPELVGRIGNKTAVANNDQIVTGIATAVYNAMMAAQEENSGGGESRIIVKIGEETIGETAVRFINGQIIQTGVSPIYS